MPSPRVRRRGTRFDFHTEAVAQGWNADWYALAAALQVQIRVVPEIPDRFVSPFDDVGYDGRDRVIYFQEGGHEPWVVHEIAHFLVATPAERDQVNYGFGSVWTSTGREAEAEEAASDLTIALWMFRRPLHKAIGRVAPTTADVASDLAGASLWWVRPALYWCAVVWRYVPWVLLEEGYITANPRDARTLFRDLLDPVLRPHGLCLDNHGLSTDPRYCDLADDQTGALVVADASLPDLLLHGDFSTRDEVRAVATVPPVQIELRDGTVLK